MSYDNWKTTEPAIVCYHEPCPHRHCAECEGERCEECEIEDDARLMEDEAQEASERCVEPPEAA